MARIIAKLSDLAVRRASEPGVYADGEGLYLQVSSSSTKSWIFRFTLNGKTREMGLGPFPTISLAAARNAASEARKLSKQGTDPIEARRQLKAAAELEAAQAISFSDAANRYIETHRPSWRNDKHAAQWQNTLNTYAAPIFGNVSIQEIETRLVLKVLEPIWSTKPETASRIRGRIESVLDWATARGYRRGDNPARWRGHLDKILPRRSMVRKVKHHAALPYTDIPEFMEALRQQPSISARALEFAILTAARTGELIGAATDEVSITGKVWTIPENRMKAGKAHRVPLSSRALSILADLEREDDSIYLFPGRRKAKGLSNMALLKVLERMGRSDLTAHGFRSTFRDWAADCTSFSREVSERALAHTIESKVEAAYMRTDLFEKRKRLMADWAAYCTSSPQEGSAQIIEFRRGALRRFPHVGP